MDQATAISIVSAGLAALALGVSALTAYLTLLRAGRLRATPPSIVFFGYDFSPDPVAKVFLRLLLFSSSRRLKRIESLYAEIEHAGVTETMSFWGYDAGNGLTPGSGLSVSHDGLAANHHFVRAQHSPDFEFLSGEYEIRVFAKEFGKASHSQLLKLKLELNEKLASTLKRRDGVLFELDPATGHYFGNARPRDT